ncbi:hypothetical protein NQZ68_023691 [Dissostichus eleginoides]|nr:hypothetical protein NQZ68_023691 [Dissostichus eleginoides]
MQSQGALLASFQSIGPPEALQRHRSAERLGERVREPWRPLIPRAFRKPQSNADLLTMLYEGDPEYKTPACYDRSPVISERYSSRSAPV